MTFEVLLPPEDAKNLTDATVEVVEAAIRMGQDVEPEGFIYSWMAGSRLVVHRDKDRNIDGIAMFTMGKRWTHSDQKAHVLLLLGDKSALLGFVVNMAKALGITGVFYEVGVIGETDEEREHLVREVIIK